MTPAFTPLLSEGRAAFLDLGEGGSAPCRIAGFVGRSVFVQLDERLLDAAEGESALQAPDAHLLIEHRGAVRGVRGHLRRGDATGTAVLQLTDGFAGQRRTFSRAPLVLPVQVHPSAPDRSGWRTFTRDVSAGGMRIARQSAWDGAMRLDLTLTVRDGRRFDVVAEVLATYPESLGLRFLEIGDEASATLAQLAVDFHRSR
jgi:hypothetical protein